MKKGKGGMSIETDIYLFILLISININGVTFYFLHNNRHFATIRLKFNVSI